MTKVDRGPNEQPPIFAPDMKVRAPRKKWWRILKGLGIGVLGVLLICAALAAWWVPRHGEAWLDNALRERIAETIDQASVEGYHFRMDSLRTDVKTGSVSVTGVQLDFAPELMDSLRSGAFQYLFDASAERIEMRGLSFWRLLWKKEFRVSSFSISGPTFNYLIGGERINLKEPFARLNRRKKSMAVTLLTADTVRVFKAAATVQDLGDRLPDMQVSGLDLVGHGVRVFMGAFRNGVRLSVTGAELQLDGMHTQLADGAALSVGRVELSLSERNGIVRDFRHVAARRDSLNSEGLPNTQLMVALDSLLLTGLEVDELIAHQVLHVGHIHVIGLQMEAALDKTLPMAPRTPKVLPPAALLGVRFPIKVDTVTVQNARLIYRERDDETERWGEVPFGHLNGQFLGITNEPGAIQVTPEVSGTLTAMMFDKAPIELTYTAALNGSQNFVINAVVTDLPAVVLNAVTRPLGRLQMDAGQLKRMYLHMEGDERKAHGKLALNYTDLKARVEPGTPREQYNSMLGTIVETMLKEPYGGGMEADRERNFNIDRDPDRALTAYLWHATREGLVRNLSPEVVDRMKQMLRVDAERRRAKRARRRATKEGE